MSSGGRWPSGWAWAATGPTSAPRRTFTSSQFPSAWRGRLAGRNWRSILARQGQNEKALPYLRQAYALNSRDAEIRYHTGVTLLALGREKEAATELRAALAQPGVFPGREEAERLLASLQP